ncbi:MAG: hypothetical protein R3C56_37345 [Pirellulaceae bacterium]
MARRHQLAQVPRRQVWSEVTGSWIGAASVIAVFSALAGLFQIGMGQAVQPLLIGTVWAALVALSVAWIAIGFGKRWQREEGDWALRAFTQLTSGFVIGAFAYAHSILDGPLGRPRSPAVGRNPSPPLERIFQRRRSTAPTRLPGLLSTVDGHGPVVEASRPAPTHAVEFSSLSYGASSQPAWSIF